MTVLITQKGNQKALRDKLSSYLSFSNWIRPSSFIFFLTCQLILLTGQAKGQVLPIPQAIKEKLFELNVAQVPPEADIGVIDKLLKQSREKPILPAQPKKPNIVKDSRKLVDPGAGPSFKVQKIVLEGNTVFSQEILEPIIKLGGELELTLGILSLFAQEVNTFYAQNGYYLTKVFIPEQEIVNGIVKFKIVEGRIGKVIVKGNKHITEQEILGRFADVLDEPVATEKILERVMLDLNDNVGLSARSILKPGDEPGTTNIILEITEDIMVNLSFSGNNYGAAATGSNGFSANLIENNIFSLGDSLSYSRNFSNGIQLSQTIAFKTPLTLSGRTTFGLSYTKSSNTLGGAFRDLNAGGKSQFFKADLGYKIFRTRKSGLNLNIGLDHKRLQNFAVGEITSDEKIYDYYLTLSGNFNDTFGGSNNYSLTLLKGFDTFNSLASRAGGNYDALVSSFNFTRIQPTGFLNSYFIYSNRGQITNKRVPSANLFSIGGNGTVRGYPIGDGGTGDWGYTSSLQYVLPVPWDLDIETNKLKLSQVLSLTGFIEHGAVFTIEGLEGEDYFTSLTGAGGGFQISLPKGNGIPNIGINLYYAYPFGRKPSDGSSGIIYIDGSWNW